LKDSGRADTSASNSPFDSWNTRIDDVRRSSTSRTRVGGSTTGATGAGPADGGSSGAACAAPGDNHPATDLHKPDIPRSGNWPGPDNGGPAGNPTTVNTATKDKINNRESRLKPRERTNPPGSSPRAVTTR
jgi:hypothetical protein